ncbi:MAG: hypothetical protein CEO21_371, partial [Microgenomates group bacterium Gr01-1014_80]
EKEIKTILEDAKSKKIDIAKKNIFDKIKQKSPGLEKSQ